MTHSNKIEEPKVQRAYWKKQLAGVGRLNLPIDFPVPAIRNRSLGIENCLFIDGRLAAEEFQVFCIKGSDNYSMHRYSHDYLFSDEELASIGGLLPVACMYDLD